MSFRLPDGSELSKEQLDIINLPTNQNWLIKGGPGTGKTVMAIYRAGQFLPNKSVLLLVYNKPLEMFLSTALKGKQFANCLISTYIQWLSDVYKKIFGTAYPKIGPFEPDWDQIQDDFKNFAPIYDHIIIDEAQDFPEELMRILRKLSSNITCFIDPNQAIEPNKLNTSNFIKTLCVSAPYKLTRNFRNKVEIHKYSVLFCKNGNDIPADTTTHGLKPTVIHSNWDLQIQKMCQIILQNQEMSIGVIANSMSVRTIYEELRNQLNAGINVQFYKTKVPNNLNFNNNGVKVISYGTMKGLEFDIVLLPKFNRVRKTGDSICDINRIYVATSRAISKLYVFTDGFEAKSNRVDTLTLTMQNRDILNWQ